MSFDRLAVRQRDGDVLGLPCRRAKTIDARHRREVAGEVAIPRVAFDAPEQGQCGGLDLVDGIRAVRGARRVIRTEQHQAHLDELVESVAADRLPRVRRVSLAVVLRHPVHEFRDAAEWRSGLGPRSRRGKVEQSQQREGRPFVALRLRRSHGSQDVLRDLRPSPDGYRVVRSVHGDDLLSDESVDLVLRGHRALHVTAETRKVRGVREAQRPQIVRVDLRVSAELPEVRVDRRAVQEDGESLGQVLGEAAVAGVQYVQLVVERDRLGLDTHRIVERGHHPPLLFLGAEAVHEDVPSRGQQEIILRAGHDQGVRLRGRSRPRHESALEVAGHDQRRVAGAGLAAQPVAGPEPDHAPRGGADPEAGERARQGPHPLGDPRVDDVGHDVQHARRIGAVNQLGRVDGSLREAGVGRTVRGRDRDLAAGAPADAVEDDVLLQHGIAGEGCVASIVDVYAAEPELAGKHPPERTEVRSVHEAAGGDRHEFAATRQESQREPHEGGVEIARLNAHGAHGGTLRALARELAVRRVQDRYVKPRRLLRREEPSMDEKARRGEDEVLLVHRAGESNAHCIAGSATVVQRPGEIRAKPLVDLPDRGVQCVGPRRRRPSTDLGDHGGRENAAPAAGVENPEVPDLPGNLQHGGHEPGHGGRREELPEVRAASRIDGQPVGDLQPFQIETLEERLVRGFFQHVLAQSPCVVGGHVQYDAIWCRRSGYATHIRSPDHVVRILRAGVRSRNADTGDPVASSATEVVDRQVRFSCLGRVSTDSIHEVAKSHNASENHVQVIVVQQQHRCTLARSLLLGDR